MVIMIAEFIPDFFKNHEHFNDSDIDIFTGTGSMRGTGGGTIPPKPPRELVRPESNAPIPVPSWVV